MFLALLMNEFDLIWSDLIWFDWWIDDHEAADEDEEFE